MAIALLLMAIQEIEGIDSENYKKIEPYWRVNHDVSQALSYIRYAKKAIKEGDKESAFKFLDKLNDGVKDAFIEYFQPVYDTTIKPLVEKYQYHTSNKHNPNLSADFSLNATLNRWKTNAISCGKWCPHSDPVERCICCDCLIRRGIKTLEEIRNENN